MNINLFKANKFDIEIPFPESWNDLLPEEIEAVAEAFLSCNHVMEIRGKVLIQIIANRVLVHKKKVPKKWMEEIDPEQFFLEGASLLDFIFHENTLTKTPFYKLNLVGAREYTVYGPEKGFESLSCGELEDCEYFFHEFEENKKMESLAMLAAILWREKVNNKRAPYQVLKAGETIEKYPAERWSTMFKRLSPAKLFAIYIWYKGCKFQLPTIFHELHSGGDGSSDSGRLSFTNCIHAGAGEKNGTRNQIRVMSLYEFMYDMELQAKQQKELEEKTKK